MDEDEDSIESTLESNPLTKRKRERDGGGCSGRSCMGRGGCS